MYPHHEESIRNLVRRFEADPEPRAVLLAGSIAHGFARPESDLDLVIVVSDDAYRDRARDRRLQFFDTDACTYPGGYAEGKYVGEGFLEEVARHGSDPARFARVCSFFAQVEDKPEGLMECIEALHRSPTLEQITRFRELCVFHHPWETPEGGWPTQFVLDSELNWRDGRPPVDDL